MKSFKLTLSIVAISAVAFSGTSALAAPDTPAAPAPPAAAAAPAPAPAAAPVPSFTDSGGSSLTILPAVEGKGETYIKTETRYLEMGYPSENFLKAVIKSTRWSEAEGSKGETKIEMRTNDKGRLDKVLWVASLDGEKVEVFNDELIAVTSFGCCGAPETVRLLNAATGKHVETAFNEVFQFEVPNTTLPKRYLSLAKDSKAPQQADGKSYIGTFSYFTATGIISRMRVYADLPKGWGAEFGDLKIVGTSPRSKTQVNRETQVTLWDSNRVANSTAAYSGFALEAKLDYDKQHEGVRLVIYRDRIDTNMSTGTSGLYLEPVN